MSNVNPDNHNPYGLNTSSASPIPPADGINLDKQTESQTPPVYDNSQYATPQYGYDQNPGYYQQPMDQQSYYQQPYGYDTYGQAPQYPGYGYAATGPMNPLGIVSMCLGILALLLGLGLGPFALLFSVPAVILGHVTLSKIKRTGERGKGFALAGVITGYISTAFSFIGILLIIFAVAACSSDPTLSSSCSSFLN